jgi:hypothetical protein
MHSASNSADNNIAMTLLPASDLSFNLINFYQYGAILQEDYLTSKIKSRCLFANKVICAIFDRLKKAHCLTAHNIIFKAAIEANTQNFTLRLTRIHIHNELISTTFQLINFDKLILQLKPTLNQCKNLTD